MFAKQFSFFISLLLVGCASTPAYQFVRDFYTYEEDVYDNLTSTGDTCFDKTSKIKKEYNKATILLIDKNKKDKSPIQVNTQIGVEFIFQELKSKGFLPMKELGITEKVKLKHPRLGGGPLFAYVNYACDNNYEVSSNHVEKFDIDVVGACVSEHTSTLFSYRKYPATEKEIKRRKLLMSCFEAKGL
ncbi:hypothetical protein CWC22_011000 [Pseudoalteromonas rubra]|uniref:Lipoprotein n=1 Tax=Pseudoalteromonas rubra TaxID=43658 RepID=A0A5S3V3U3_9GAMM|nr:hypothetical protein [Pseudoalteromonas rubra]QPB83486.1 hypothetical protein CWC22_011000 [Pseudoalteromonas rubra]